jgi:hypothetical protein
VASMSNFGFVCLKLEKIFSSETTGPTESKLYRYDVCGWHSSSLFLDSYEADFIQDFPVSWMSFISSLDTINLFTKFGII